MNNGICKIKKEWQATAMFDPKEKNSF